MPPASQSFLEEHVLECVGLLRSLQCKQRPSTAASLASWIKRRSCRQVNVPLAAGPSALAAAMMPLLHDTPKLQQALLPLTELDAPSVDGKPSSADAPEPVAKRPRTDLAEAPAQAELAAAAARAAQRLPHCKEFVISSLSARFFWLQSQAHCHSRVEPRKLIDEMVKRGVISESASGGITYEEAAICGIPLHKKARPTVEGARATLEQPIIEVALGTGDVLTMQLEALKKADTSKLASEWRLAALQNSGVKPDSVERLRVKIDQRSQLVGLTVRMAAPKDVASAFCSTLQKVVETSILKEYSPVQVQITPVSLQLPRDEFTCQALEQMLSCKIEVVCGVEADSEALPGSRKKGKGRGKDKLKDRRKPEDMKRSIKPEDLHLVATFPRDVDEAQQKSACEILRLISNVSPAFTCKLPHALRRDVEDRIWHSELLMAVDATVSFWPSMDMLRECMQKLIAKKAPKEIHREREPSSGEESLDSEGEGKGKGKGKGKGIGEQILIPASELLLAFQQSIEKARIKAERRARDPGYGSRRSRYNQDHRSGYADRFSQDLTIEPGHASHPSRSRSRSRSRIWHGRSRSRSRRCGDGAAASSSRCSLWGTASSAPNAPDGAAASSSLCSQMDAYAAAAKEATAMTDKQTNNPKEAETSQDAEDSNDMASCLKKQKY